MLPSLWHYRNKSAFLWITLILSTGYAVKNVQPPGRITCRHTLNQTRTTPPGSSPGYAGACVPPAPTAQTRQAGRRRSASRHTGSGAASLCPTTPVWPGIDDGTHQRPHVGPRGALSGHAVPPGNIHLAHVPGARTPPPRQRLSRLALFHHQRTGDNGRLIASGRRSAPVFIVSRPPLFDSHLNFHFGQATTRMGGDSFEAFGQ